jgi:hypothetical protein
MTTPMTGSGGFAGKTCFAGPGPRVIRVGEVPGSNPGAPMFENPCGGGGFRRFEDAQGSNEVPFRRRTTETILDDELDRA